MLSQGPLPTPKTIWVTNSGPGDLVWSASSDAAWLTVTPAGNTPASLSFAVVDGTLPAGEYTAHVIVSGGAKGSPHTVVVTLNVIAGTSHHQFLPLISR